MKDINQLLNNELENINEALQPENDLWPGIEHAINHGSDKTWITFNKPATALAASILVAALISMLVILKPGSTAIDTEVLQALSVLQKNHAGNLQSLMVDYQERSPSYPDWEVEMQQLEEAEALLYNALLEDPNNMALLELLRQIQDKQIALLNMVYAPRLTTI